MTSPKLQGIAPGMRVRVVKPHENFAYRPESCEGMEGEVVAAVADGIGFDVCLDTRIGNSDTWCFYADELERVPS